MTTWLSHSRGALRTLQISAVWLCVHLLPLSAAAQAAPGLAEPPPQEELERGREAFNREDYVTAYAHFTRAHAQNPSARTLRALAFVDFALDHYALARERLTRALVDTRLPLTDEQRTEARELLLWMTTNLGEVRLDCSPEDARATIDGNLVTHGDLLLSAGDHQLHVSAKGFAPQERRFRLEINGKPFVLRVDLVKLAPPPQAMAGETSKLWLALGISGASLLAVGAVCFGVGMFYVSEVEHPSEPITPETLASLQTASRWWTGIGVGLGVVGIAGAATAVVLRLRQERGPEASRAGWFYELNFAALAVGRRFQ